MEDNSEFYRDLDFLPTISKISSGNLELLNDYFKNRKYLFEYCLRLPITTLHNRAYLEIGPDSGENALVAAMCGSRVTLIDKNPKAIEKCKEVFDRFGLIKCVEESQSIGFEEFNTDKKFFFVAAEGFIHSIRDKENLYPALRGFVSNEGFLLISYYEKFSCFADLFQARLFQSLVLGFFGKSWFELDLEEVLVFGEALFKKKWDTKPHTRSLRSWILDILLNPALDLDLAIDIEDTVKDFYENGFELWSSWPNYDLRSQMRWHRLERDIGLESLAIREQIRERRLAHVFGLNIPPLREPELESILTSLVASVNSASYSVLYSQVIKLKEIIESASQSFSAKQELLSILNMISEISREMSSGEFINVKELIEGKSNPKSSHHSSFVNFWGQPNHFSLFKKLH